MLAIFAPRAQLIAVCGPTLMFGAVRPRPYKAERAEQDVVGRGVFRVELEAGALEILHGVGLAVGLPALELVADRVAVDEEAAVLLPVGVERPPTLWPVSGRSILVAAVVLTARRAGQALWNWVPTRPSITA